MDDLREALRDLDLTDYIAAVLIPCAVGILVLCGFVLLAP
jgi:hypothetical protein